VLGAASGRDIAISDDRFESSRNFANKLWNATRFIFMNMERSGVEPQIPPQSAAPRFEDRWIQSRLHAAIISMNSDLEVHRYHEAGQTIWHFFWDEFCDWYLEIKKLRFTADSGLNEDWRALLTTFETGLRLLHPIMPFLTEEISNRLDEGHSISLKKYPDATFAKADPDADREMDLLKQVVGDIRETRQARNREFKQVTLKTASSPEVAVIESLAKVQLHWVQQPGPGRELFYEFLDQSPEAMAAEHAKLKKEAEQLDKVIANSKRQLSNEAFVTKAPEKVLNEMRDKLIGYEAQLAKVQAAISELSR
jgi:valyl-tRNA synthetase